MPRKLTSVICLRYSGSSVVTVASGNLLGLASLCVFLAMLAKCLICLSASGFGFEDSPCGKDLETRVRMYSPRSLVKNEGGKGLRNCTISRGQNQPRLTFSLYFIMYMYSLSGLQLVLGPLLEEGQCGTVSLSHQLNVSVVPRTFCLLQNQDKGINFC